MAFLFHWNSDGIRYLPSNDLLAVATVMKAEEVPPVPPVTGIVPPVEAHFPLEGPSLSMLLTLGLVLLMIFILRKREGERMYLSQKREPLMKNG